MKKDRKMKVIKIAGQKFLMQSRFLFLGLLTVLLVSGCSSSPLPPVERIVTKTEVQIVAVAPPRKPDQIAEIEFNHFVIVNQNNIETILEEIENGEREPLNHVMLPYNYYLDLATWMKSIENYVIGSEQYFKSVEEAYNKNK